MAEPTRDEIEAQRRLVARLGELGFVLPGSLVRRHTRCGNRRCHCYGEPPELHGPYLQWTRTEANKTVSRIWSDEQLSRYEGWLDNARLAGRPSARWRHSPSRSCSATSDLDPPSRNGGPADHSLVIHAEGVT
jgi:hypothetical protein